MIIVQNFQKLVHAVVSQIKKNKFVNRLPLANAKMLKIWGVSVLLCAVELVIIAITMELNVHLIQRRRNVMKHLVIMLVFQMDVILL